MMRMCFFMKLFHPNPLSMKRSLIFLLAVVLIAAAAVVTWLYVFQGKRSYAPVSVNPAFAEFVASYSAGMVGSGSAVQISFTRDVVDSATVGQTDPRPLFEFTPKIKGKVRWLDRRTVAFIPDGRWPRGKLIEGRFRLSSVMNVPDDLSVFTWSFRIMAQYLDLTVENVAPYVQTDLSRVKIEGYVQTADYAEPEEVKKSLRAMQDGKPLSVTWNHAEDGRQHHFVIEDVSRRETANKVIISADGSVLGVRKKFEREVEIPSLTDFRVMEVKVVQGTSQHVLIRFSDPLDESQNLFGLIRLPGVGTPEYQIDGNLLRIYPSTRQSGNATLSIEAGVRNTLNKRLMVASTYNLNFEDLKPAVRFTGKGTILPNSEGLILPFEAVNLKSVDVQVIRIYENNILQFLQVNDMDGNQDLRRVGKPVLKKPFHSNMQE